MLFKTRVSYAVFYAVANLALNLIIRAIWFPEKDLFSWNVPVALILGAVSGLALFATDSWFVHKRAEQIAELEETREALERLKRWLKAESFLNDPARKNTEE